MPKKTSWRLHEDDIGLWLDPALGVLVQSAAICSGRGDIDCAFELMEKALAVRDDRMLWIKVDPRLDNLRAC